MNGTPDRDVVLVTIDCWRHDALEWMPILRERVAREGYARADAICQAPATRGAFPAIFAGQYYPQVYAGFDDIRPTVESLPETLSRAGYATGGFVGSNPFLSRWSGGFDEFWNDGLFDRGGGRLRAALSKARHAGNYLAMRGRVPASDVADRARSWYGDAGDKRRFLWMHLMEPHVPFLPGWRRGLRAGPLSVYRAHWRFNRDPDLLTDRDRATLRECYRLSVAYLDEQLDAVLEFLDDDAVVVLVGDHGEEFDHGGFGHARLYDETVRVPLLAKGLEAVEDGDRLRQLDVPATVLDELDRPIPSGWEGRPYAGQYRDAFMLNHSPRFGHVYAGIRTDRYKLIRTVDADTRAVVDREAYDLATDPRERVDVFETADVDHLQQRLETFLSRPDIADGLLERRGDAGAVVEQRLEALGYK